MSENQINTISLVRPSSSGDFLKVSEVNPPSKRDYTPLDRLVVSLDRTLSTVFGNPPTTGRKYPASEIDSPEPTGGERRLSGQLMRVNHTGEICAQALYQGQSLTARSSSLQQTLQQASDEENDHLDWCSRRLSELKTRPSHLGPLFYAGSFTLGLIAGMAGDRSNLGFLAETEHQVVRHLEGHLAQLPEQDLRSRAILLQMAEDEARHATTALRSGGSRLPYTITRLMSLSSKIMTSTTFWI